MFEARIKEGGVLKKINDGLKDLVTEANFECSSTGLSLQAMDSSHVSLVALRLASEKFDHFRCDRALSIGINLTSLSKHLRPCGNDSIVTLKADDQSDNLSFMFEHPDQQRITSSEMKLMDIDSEHLGIPDTDFTATVKMSSSEFQHICKDFKELADTVSIAVSKNAIKFSVTGEMGSMEHTIQPSGSPDTKEEDRVEIECKEPVALKFALRYLLLFTKATPLSPRVTLSLSKDVPLVAGYPIEEMGDLRYYLAPKIEDDE